MDEPLTRQLRPGGRPHVVFLADRPNWAFDFVARSVAARLGGRFRFSHAYVCQSPQLSADDFDLLYVFSMQEDWYRQFGIPREKVIKEVACFRWRADESLLGGRTPETFAREYLEDCGVVTAPAARLCEVLRRSRDEVFQVPNGFEPGIFHPGRPRRGPLRIGWVGNPRDPEKGLQEILMPACRGRFQLDYSPGTWSRARVARLYREVDVLAVASTNESQPLPLIESLASGCFPVVTDVGIVPELVNSGETGLVVERSVEAFREAFAWCETHLDQVRQIGMANAERIRKVRSWDRCAPRYAAIFDYALARQQGRPAAAPPETPPTLGHAEDGTAGETEAVAEIAGWNWRLRDAWTGRWSWLRPVRNASYRWAGSPLRWVLKTILPKSWREALHRKAS